MSFDAATFAEAFSYPGIDPRQWVSIGVVDADAPDARSTRFKDDAGNPLPSGPVVMVTLQPSGIQVACRVANFIAGLGEGAWFPFMANDEVLVALPQGSESMSPTIIGRLNQEIDTWPGTVAGQDATTNTFGFWRLRTPFIIESGEAFLIRSAKTGSQVGIDGTGQVILNQGDRNNVFIGADAISISDGDETVFIQLNFSERRTTIAVDQARIELSGAGDSIFFCPGSLNIGSGGVAGKGHGITLEQVMGLLANYTVFLSLNGVAGLGGILATPSAFDAVLSAMVLGAAAPAPPSTPIAAYFGNYTQMPLTFGPTGAITAGLSTSSFLAAADVTGFILGIGRASLLY